MNSLFVLLAQASSGASAPGGASQPAPSMDSFTLMLLAVVGISMYLLIWRPQSKADAEKKARVEKLAKGDRIVTIGGIHGEIHDPQPGKSTVVVQVDKAVRLVFNKSAIHQVNPEPEGKSKEEEKK